MTPREQQAVGRRRSVHAHRDKVKHSVTAALSGLADGDSVAVSGFGLCGNPEALIRGVVDLGVRSLTLVSNNAGNLGKGLALWLRAGIVERVICTYIGNNTDLHTHMARGTVTVDVVPQGTFVERLRAAGAGLGGFYTSTGVGTVVADGKEERVLGGRRHLFEAPLPVDFALIRAHRSDDFGNLRFFRTARNFAEVMAMAAHTTVAEVDSLVPRGAIDPDDVHLPGVFVHRVVHVPDHEDAIEVRTTRPHDDHDSGGGTR